MRRTCNSARTSAMRAWRAWVLALLPAGMVPQAAVATTQPPLPVLCAWAGAAVPSGAASAPAGEPPLTPDECAVVPPAVRRGTLEGPGQVTVVVPRAAWKAARATGHALKPRLYINGLFASGEPILRTDEPASQETMRISYRVPVDKTTQALWTGLYRQQRDMSVPIELRAALSWDGAPVDAAPAADDRGPHIRVTTENREFVGLALMALLAGFLLWCLFETDVFRDAPARPVEQLPSPPPNARPGSLVRATFSLARLQAGLWLFVVLASGLFMWIVLGELPPPEPTLVALLGVSAATTLASLAVDTGAGPRPFLASKNLLVDVVTGWDGAQQFHRSQALAVNMVLLAVVAEHVMRTLSYPAIDGTLLALLGVSGIAQAGGKQVLEGPAPDTPTAAKPNQLPSGRRV